MLDPQKNTLVHGVNHRDYTPGKAKATLAFPANKVSTNVSPMHETGLSFIARHLISFSQFESFIYLSGSGFGISDPFPDSGFRIPDSGFRIPAFPYARTQTVAMT